MRRDVIVRVIKRLIDDLTTTGVEAMFDEATNAIRKAGGPKDERNFVSFAVFQKYSVATATYGEAERALAKILGLEPLFSPETWQRLASSPDPSVIFEMARQIHFAKADLPKVINLFKQENVGAAREDGDKLPRQLQGKTTITFILPEEEHEYSSPARLIAALEAITNLYGVFCILENQSESELIVLACDSGSDKSFDFLGVAKLMEEIRTLVIAIWDRRVFYRHMHASQCIGLIAESLPVIERIEALKQSRALEPEQAELLKRKTLLGATQFLKSGIYIDEMASEGRQSPRQLMRPEPKLLAAPSTTAPSADSGIGDIDTPPTRPGGGTGTLTDDDVAHLERLLAKAKGGNAISPQQAPEKPSPRKRKAIYHGLQPTTAVVR